MNEHNNNDGQMEETMTDAKNPWNADLNDPYLGLKLASERLSIVRYVFLVQIEDGIASAAQRASLESAEADSELAISYVVEPERRMSDLSVESAGSAVATGRRSARGNWHSRPRIGIMGGTFDPIHNGHLVAASEVSWVYDLDEVIFVPTGRPVFKLDKNVTNAEDRYLMTPRVLIAGRGETAGRQGRYVGNTGTGDFLDRCAATCGAWGACLVPRTGRRGAIYWQARTVPVNFR